MINLEGLILCVSMRKQLHHEYVAYKKIPYIAIGGLEYGSIATGILLYIIYIYIYIHILYILEFRSLCYRILALRWRYKVFSCKPHIHDNAEFLYTHKIVIPRDSSLYPGHNCRYPNSSQVLNFENGCKVSLDFISHFFLILFLRF